MKLSRIYNNSYKVLFVPYCFYNLSKAAADALVFILNTYNDSPEVHVIMILCTCQETDYCFPLCHSTTEEIIPQNSRAHLAEDEKETKLKIRLNSNDICNYLFFHLFLKMNVLNQVSVPQQSENIKCSCRKMDVPVGVMCT